jgi:hypothetical protein
MAGYTHSAQPTDDEVTIAWLVCELEAAQKAQVLPSNSSDLLKRLIGCTEEASAILEEVKKRGGNHNIIVNLEEAETYLEVAQGYLAN